MCDMKLSRVHFACTARIVNMHHRSQSTIGFDGEGDNATLDTRATGIESKDEQAYCLNYV
jgi:hypothetical protein